MEATITPLVKNKTNKQKIEVPATDIYSSYRPAEEKLLSPLEMPCHQSFRVTDCVSDSQQPCAPALDLKKKINQHLESVVNWCILHPDRATLLNSPVKTHSLTVSCNFQAQLARLGHTEESSARQHLLQKGSWEKDKSNITTATLSSGSVTS